MGARRHSGAPVGRGISTQLIGGRVYKMTVVGSTSQTRPLLEPQGLGGRISVRFAEAAALPCVQNMRGASVIILSLMLNLMRFRRVGGSAGELKIDSERVPKTGKQRFRRRE